LIDIIEFFGRRIEGDTAMKQGVRFFSILILIIFVLAAQGLGDTVLLHNGDRLIGAVNNRYFALQSPYGQLIIRNDFLKRLSLPDSRWLDAKLQTINNDLFSGTILNKDIQFQPPTGDSEILDIRDVRLIVLDTGDPSYPIITTIFTTQSNDRFSGKLTYSELRLEADFATTTYQVQDLNRIEFSGDEKTEVRVLLTNGDIIEGVLQRDDILIEPDSLSRLIIPKSGLRSVQFKARKLVLKEYDRMPAAEKDGDGDGLPNYLDNCPDTPLDIAVDDYGCSAKPITSGMSTPADNAKKGHQPDMDGDGVFDPLDRCLQRPVSASVDQKGCWTAPQILFDVDSAEIKPAYYPALKAIISVLKTNPGLKIEIQGKTDNTGPEIYNQMLSEKRARAVKESMVGQGIDPRRLEAVGYGATKNVAANGNDASRALNRRIDFVPVN
jgi:outer membrane protein OmpA-like peptidoglycan-associated protein